MVSEGGRRIVFGGDLGPVPSARPAGSGAGAAADVLLLEATYGDRRHEPDDDGARFGRIVSEPSPHGKAVIPAFAVGRVEEVLYWLKRLEEARESRWCRCSSTVRWLRGARVLPQAGGRARRGHAGRAGKPRPALRPAASRLCRRRRSPRSWSRQERRPSSSRPAAWPRAGGCSTI